jgi:type IV pilus assembly protein PilX
MSYVAKIRYTAPAARQQGIILIVALIVLVALSLASVGLLRSVDGANAVGGNLGSKKDIYRVASVGFQAAVNDLGTIRVAGQLPATDNSTVGFASTASLIYDSRGVPQALVDAPIPSSPGVATNWGGGEFVLPVVVDSGTGVATSGGYVFRWVADRLCPNALATDPAVNACRMASGSGSNTAHGLERKLPGAGQVYVRITLRIDGAKNATSYFQAMVL